MIPSITCPDFIYEVVMSDGSPIDPNVFTFNAAEGTLTTETSDPTKAGNYKMKLTASYGATYPEKGSVDFVFAILSIDTPYVFSANDPPTFKDTQIANLLLDKASGDFLDKVLGTLYDTERDPLIVTFSGLENYMIAIYDQASG